MIICGRKEINFLLAGCFEQKFVVFRVVVRRSYVSQKARTGQEIEGICKVSRGLRR